MTVTATHGTAVVRRDGFARVLTPGVTCRIEPFQPLELLIAGSLSRPAVCIVEMLAMSDTSAQPTLYRHLSRRIFLEPQLPWSADHAAMLLGESPGRIRRTLFAEGAALGELCRTQRLMRLLFEFLSGHASLPALKRSIGWPVNQDLEVAFHDRFGAPLYQFQYAATAHEMDSREDSARYRQARTGNYWLSLSPA